MKTIKYSKDVVKFLDSLSMQIIITGSERTFYILPFWFEIIDKEKGLVKVYRSHTNLPEDLRAALTDLREKTGINLNETENETPGQFSFN